MEKLWLVFFFGILITAWCATAWQPAGGGACDDCVSKEVTIRHGQQANVGGTDVSVEFVSVGEDSRCPKGVQCIWAGSVKVNLRLRANKTETELQLNTNRQPRVTEFQGLFFSIAKVEPPKVIDQKIKPEDYVITLAVSRERPAGSEQE